MPFDLTKRHATKLDTFRGALRIPEGTLTELEQAGHYPGALNSQVASSAQPVSEVSRSTPC